MRKGDKIATVQSGFAEAIISELNDVMMQLGLHRYITTAYKYMYEMGRRNASLGVLLNNVSDVARRTAQEMFQHVYMMLKESLAAALTEKRTRLRIMEDDKQNHQRYRAYYDYVQRQYLSFPRSYSWFLCICYFFIGFALLFIAMPLLLILVQQGFNITGSVGNDKILAELLTAPFWEIINLNREQVVTGVGIATCIAYLLIFYDDFIAAPRINKTVTFKRFVQQNNLVANLPESKRAPQGIKQNYCYKQWIQIGLAILTAIAIMVLTFFRFQTAYPSNDEGFTFVNGILLVVGIVFFPVISGLCLAYSLGILRNIVRLARVDYHCIRLRTKHLYSVEAYVVAQKKYEDLFAGSLYLGEEANMIGGYHNALLAFYQRGFGTDGKGTM